MTFKAVKGAIERMLDKNLQDLVRGIRNHKEDEVKYIAECLDEIKSELKLDNLAAKANAINKLIYLQMLGNDIDWAAFNIIEVMSSTKFTYKRIGYLAAAQSFHEQTDVLMLTTNLIRKDLNSPNYYETGVALSGLACFITPDLARDLAGDIMTLMTSTKPYIRKKSVLLMYKVFLKFPDALRPAFPRLKEKLEDPDPGVQSAAVNVICELARKNPKNYLSLAPLFFKLMNTSNNNWVLIKIIKLFGALTPLEPRLGKKLIEPLTNLIHSTSAMSLLYECINTVIAGIPDHSASIQLCVQKLRILIEDSDQNLKYLGLLAMTKILKSHPKSVQSHKDLILNCLDDKDESIRLRALDLLYGMISKKNIMEIVKKLMTHMDKAEGSHYRNELLVKIIEITSQNNYHYITNFEWYVTVLVELTRIDGIKNGELIAAQLLDVAIRVPTVRHFTVNQMASILHTSSELMVNAKQSGVSEVIYAAAWICGEYAEYLVSPKATLDQMIQSTVGSLPGHIQSVLVQNTLKLYCRHLLKLESETPSIVQSEGDSPKSDNACIELTQLVLDKMALLVHSSDLEVQERAVSSHQLLRYVLKQQKTQLCGTEISMLFGGEINPVTSNAQKRVPIPEGLDLDAWINEPPPPVISDDDDESISSNKVSKKHKRKKTDKSSRNKSNELFVKNDVSEFPKIEITEEEIEQMREMRLKEQHSNPNYLKESNVESVNGYINLGASDEPPPLEPLENLLGADTVKSLQKVNNFPNSDFYRLQDKIKQEKTERKLEKKKKRHRKAKQAQKSLENDEDEEEFKHVVKLNFDAPEGIEPEKDKNDKSNFDLSDPHRLLDIDLEKPLTEEEKLPKQAHRSVSNAKANVEPVKEKSKEKKVKHSKGKEKHSSKELSNKNDLSSVQNTEENKHKSSERKKKSSEKNDNSEKSRNLDSKVIKEKKAKEIVETKTEEKDPFSEWSTNDPSSNKTVLKRKNCFSNLSPVKIDPQEFADLLASGTLQQKRTVKLKKDILITNFKSCIKLICKKARFSIVEEIQSTASMYTKNLNNNHVCLLMKVTNEGSCVSIEAKSDNETLVEDVTRSLKYFIRNHFKIDAPST